ncbi:HupA family protein [Neptuniibacter marinus]|uniref:hypothetical protein n=1 Tax=Neptuniibacter marinus TaxID=1806670 RepID=UPI000831C25C|nr:hypothetical protein [Neptuniibacter marinus]
MRKSTLALAVMAILSSNAVIAASPNVQGGSSNDLLVDPYASNHSVFGGGDSGLELNSYGTAIDVASGPINGSNNAITDHGNGAIMTPGDLGMLNLPINIAQVWKDTETVTGGSNDANFVVNSVRQITKLSFAPQFGGLVIGQVADASGDPLAAESGVYFGEWAPAVDSPDADSYDLNMTSADRTVWYVGDDAVKNDEMPTLDDVEYGVVGISQTGTNSSGVTLDGGLPDSVNLYKGTLTANYCSGCSGNELTGSISRTVGATTQTIDFDATTTTINSDGTFGNSAATNTIEGRFYNDAEALAGMYTNGTYDDTAFGGSKVSGTITP